MTMMIKTYSDLKKLGTFKARYEYLKLNGHVGKNLFGEDRRLNQFFYHTDAWKHSRDIVIVRDKGLDLGCQDYDIIDRIIVHHMNPITVDDLEDFDNQDIFDPEFLITTSVATHLAIHYGDKRLLPRLSTKRFPNDTKLW